MISLVAFVVIVFGIRYAILQAASKCLCLFLLIQNMKVCTTQPLTHDEDVEWGDRLKENAKGITYRFTDDSFAIIIDRNSNTSESQAKVPPSLNVVALWCSAKEWGLRS